MTDRCVACGLDVYDGGQLCTICLADPPPGYSPNGANSPVELSTHKTPTPLQQAALDAISKYDGVVAAARALGCNHGVISLAKAGHDFPKARRVLGLPPRTVPVPPCAECGKVHDQLHTCPHELQKARTRPPRIRSHYEHGYGDAGAKHKAQLQAEMVEAGCDSFTEYVDYLRKVKDANR